MEANQAPQMGLFCPQLTAQGVLSPLPRPSVACSYSVSVLPDMVGIEPTTLQQIDETCICSYSSTSATGWVNDHKY